MTARPDTEVVYDPATYVEGVPFAALARLREHTPVVWAEEVPVLGWPGGPGLWLVLRHADVQEVLTQPRLFSSWLGATQIRDPATPEALGYVRQMMLNMDPPGHSRLRRLLARSFTPRAVARLEQRIRGYARALCDRVLAGDGGECDFAKDLAADMPLLTLADVLGLPEQDRYLLFDWSNRVIGYQDPDYASSAEFDSAAGSPLAREAVALRPGPGPDGRLPDPRTREGLPDLYAYAHLLADEKRRRPGDDIMSILLAQVDDDGGQVSVEEFENLFWLFAVAGNETLRNGLPGACIALLEHPAAQDELRADAALLPVAADEMLRWWTPVMTFRRTAAEDCQIGSQPVRSGEKVVVSFTSANRDEAVFADPGRFDIRRQPNPHLVFGHGPHFCLGAHLARTQMRALFAEVLARTSRLEAA
ncbi:MAG TPA: cytochrome P450, partial [Streptosporangiaceae bacterium]